MYVERWLRDARPWLPDYRSATMRLAVAEGESGWYVVACRIDFRSEAAEPSTREIPTVSHLRLFDIVLAPEEAFRVIQEDLIQGRLAVGSDSFKLALRDGPPQHRFNYLRSGRPWNWDTIRDLALSYNEGVNEFINSDRFDSIAEALPSSNPPFDGLDGVYRDFVRIDRGAQNHVAIIEVHAPAPLTVMNTSLKQGLLAVEFYRAPVVRPEGAKLAIIARYPKAETRPHLVDLSEDVLEKGATSEITGVPSEILVLASYFGKEVSRLRIPGPLVNHGNVMVTAAKTFGADLEDLRSALSKAKAGRDLEAQVAALFGLLGCRTLALDVIAEECPDLVAMPFDDSCLYVIEATARELDSNGKISKFHARNNRIQAEVDLPVCPVLITAYPRSAIHKDDLEKAGSAEIAVVALEDLQAMVAMAFQAPEPARLKDFLGKLVPKRHPTIWGRKRGEPTWE